MVAAGPDRSLTATPLTIRDGGPSDLSEVTDFYEDALIAGIAPGDLLTVTAEETGFYKLGYYGSVQYWDVTRLDGDRLVRSGQLDPPADLRHPAPADFAVSPDGTKLFVAWSGKGVDNVRRGCATGVYDAHTFGRVAMYTFPAARLAPSADGLTLWMVNSAAKGEEMTLTQIDID